MPYKLFATTSKQELIEAAAEIFPAANVHEHTIALDTFASMSLLNPKISDGDSLYLVPRLRCALILMRCDAQTLS
jgi:hypothetical protein